MPDVTRPPPGRGIRKATRGAPTISSPPGDLGDSSCSFDILRTSGDPHSRGRGGIKSKELAGQGHGSSLASRALRSAPPANPGFLKAAVHWVRVNGLSAESSPNLTWDAMGLRADSARRLSVRAEPLTR